MISTLVTGGSTLVGSAGSGRYYGARLQTGAFTLTVHDANGTGVAALDNTPTNGRVIDQLVHVAAQPTLIASLTGGAQGVGYINGLVTVLTAGGTATIFYD